MISLHKDTKTGVLIYEIRGTITYREEKEWIEQITAYLENEKKIRILLILGDNACWSLNAAFEDGKWLIKHMRHIEKMAIVSDSRWWKWYVKVDILAKFFGTKEAWFPSERTAEALAWVGG